MSRKRALQAGLLTMATAALSATAFAGMSGTATAAPGAAGGEKFGCPYGAVCLYDNEQDWENRIPEHVYWSYGVHELKNEYGTGYMYNNQSGGATMANCDTADGRGCSDPAGPGYLVIFDIDPKNSIKLMP